jgi:hypothetical protein
VSKGLMAALIIMGITVVLLLFNKGSVDVNLILGSIRALKSLVFLAFLGVGVVIGVLIK